ncbi:MAG: hypothetical protein DRJ07_03360 [Bacteroidetes bacterium]|nr:MAG: hypothetical protein DRJ07_03360 [Bacteroidota bacterium]
MKMEIKDVLKMKLGKDDTILIKHSSSVLTEEIMDSQELLETMFPDNKSLFVDENWDINIIEKKNEWIQIGEGPACFQLIKSGWGNGKKYHLLYEDPEEGNYHYTQHFVSEIDITNRFPYAIERMEELKND